MTKPREKKQPERDAENAAWDIYWPESLTDGPAAAFGAGWNAAYDYCTDPSYCVSCDGPCRDESPDPSEQIEDQLKEVLDMLEHIFLGFVFYSTATIHNECYSLLRKHGRLAQPHKEMKK